MAMAKPEVMKQIAFAEYLGVARSYITQLKQQGRLVMTERGLVDVEASIIRIQETADPNRDDVAARHAKERGAPTAVAAAAEKTEKPAKQKREKDPNQITFADGRAKEQHFRALQAELDYQKAIGEVVPVADMRHAVADMVMTFRQAMENMPHRLAADLVGQDHDYIRAALKREVHDMLAELQRACDEKIKAQVTE